MGATLEQIAQLRRMVGEPTTTNYDDATLRAYIERYPLKDINGENPFIESGYETDLTNMTSIGQPAVNSDWIATYDLNAAAADVWAEKAASYTEQYDFGSPGVSAQRSQIYAQMMQQSRYYASRRAVRTIRQYPEPLARGLEAQDAD